MEAETAGMFPKSEDRVCDDTLIVHSIGDIALNGLYCYPPYQVELARSFAALASDLGECNLRVANWEAPLWGGGGVNLLKNPRLCTTEEAASTVLHLRLDVALLANNHVYDCLEGGFYKTVAFLEANNIRWLGAGCRKEDAARPLVVERGGQKLGLLNYVALDTHPCIPDTAGVHVNILEEGRALEEVKSLRHKVDHVLVYLHWGVDYASYATAAQRRFARSLVDAGAALVVGHHAHVLQGHEQWRHGHIFYGLGNCVFDRVHRDYPLLQKSMIGGVAISRLTKCGHTTGELLPIVLDNMLVQLDRTSRTKRMIDRLNRPLHLPDAQYSQFVRYRVSMDALARLRHRLRYGGGLSGTLAYLWHRCVTAGNRRAASARNFCCI